MTLNANDYAALKALYDRTGGKNWTNNTGWKDWDFSRETPPDANVVDRYWHGVRVEGSRVTLMGTVKAISSVKKKAVGTTMTV
ncbi:MAG: hypothetical protein GDA43_01620 [Hormoscilla sp. SP5CHS1]|nr:hypothetical protein [Hormoscilla sp. SP12CHS1]MBC6452050.1 hypothetical protein [Hormoscilla sp. SP5CHS1]